MDTNNSEKQPGMPAESANRNPIPILGEVVKTSQSGVYAVKQRALVGKRYFVACPSCGKYIMVNPTEPKVMRVMHQPCNVPIIVGCVDNTQPAAPDPTTVRVHVAGQKTNGKLSWWTLSGRKSYTLKLGKNYVGRKEQSAPSHLSIKDEFASARSICIEAIQSPRGYFFHLTVERATNPVYVNGKELTAGCGIDLNFGDIIKLGKTSITFNSAKK